MIRFMSSRDHLDTVLEWKIFHSFEESRCRLEVGGSNREGKIWAKMGCSEGVRNWRAFFLCFISE